MSKAHLSRSSSRRPAKVLVLAGMLAVFLASAAGCRNQARTESPPLEDLVFAETYEFWTAPTLVAGVLDLYREVGLNVKVAKFQTGLAAKNAVLTGSADLGLVATTPIAIGGFQNEDVTLIATYVESDAVVKLVSHSSDKPLTPEFLIGRRVGYIPGTISELVLQRMIEKSSLDAKRITRAAFRPPELIPAFSRKDIDAFVAWEPLPLLAKRDVPGAQIFLDRSLYTVSLHLVTRPVAVLERPGALVKFLRAVELAEERIAADPESTREAVEGALDLPPGTLAEVWDDFRFVLKLDCADLIADLKAEGEWAQGAGYVSGSLPGYDRYCEPRILESLRAE